MAKAPRRSKAGTPKILKVRLERKQLVHLDRQMFIDFGKGRAKEGLAPHAARENLPSRSGGLC
jgi:hypothetical protein